MSLLLDIQDVLRFLWTIRFQLVVEDYTSVESGFSELIVKWSILYIIH